MFVEDWFMSTEMFKKWTYTRRLIDSTSEIGVLYLFYDIAKG